jgi:UDP-N-acetylmuramate dehydrogenase
VRIYDKKQKKIYVLPKEELGFSYRSSIFANSDFLILSAKIRFLKSDSLKIKENLDYFLNKRKSSQPYGQPSLGSIFKRHKDAPISYLIDKAGLKGVRIGGAEISLKHAGFIINAGGACAKDVLELITLIKENLSVRYGIIPEEEIEILV